MITEIWTVDRIFFQYQRFRNNRAEPLDDKGKCLKEYKIYGMVFESITCEMYYKYYIVIIVC